MSENHADQTQVLEHDESSLAKKVLNYGWNSDTLQTVRQNVDSDGDTQVDIKTSALPIGAATSDNQTNLQSILEAVKTTQEEIHSLNETILELVSRLSVLGAVKGTSADLRVTPLSTPNMTTLGNITSIGGSNANTIVEDVMNISAQLSNINNIN